MWYLFACMVTIQVCMKKKCSLFSVHHFSDQVKINKKKKWSLSFQYTLKNKIKKVTWILIWKKKPSGGHLMFLKPGIVVESVISDSMSPQCGLDFESKPIFLHNTLAHDDASAYNVWLQKVQHLRRYHPEEQSLEFWPFPVTMTLTTTEESNLYTRQSSS